MRRITSILLVEDKPSDQVSIRHALDSRGIIYAMTIATSAEEALSIMTRLARPPEIVLISHELPKMSGLECAKRIQSNQMFSSCRIFLLSSSNEIDQLTKAASTVSGIIKKPIQFKCTTSKDMIHLMIDLMNG